MTRTRVWFTARTRPTRATEPRGGEPTHPRCVTEVKHQPVRRARTMHSGKWLLIPGYASLFCLGLVACSQQATEPPQPQAAAPSQRGEASYYGPGFEGRRTASGERFDATSDTAAHRTLPLGTVAEVTNLETGQSERVTIRDRGPYVRGRVIDVTPRTAERLGMRRQGVAPVEVTPIAVPPASVGGAGGRDSSAR
jgi:rare lipoprotein A